MARSMNSTSSNISRSLVRHQHHYLHYRIDELNSAIQSQISHEHLIGIVRELQEYMELHWQAEVNMMNAVRYPKSKLDCHRADHSVAMLNLSELVSDVSTNNSPPKKISEFIIEWTHLHESTEDRDLSLFMNNYLDSNKLF